ncbi:MAG: ClpX C4-type zinc finger protein [Phycisphaerales bacterium]|nr:ClpX C4-type zinc finger protein [Phycisphaerales bacterium]
MHNTDADGNEFFICDFCRRPWAEERPMVEGHRGSLICAPCLTVAYTELVHLHLGAERAGTVCTMCLENRSQPQWESPLFAEAHACVRCVRQAAGVLSKDPESGWKRPEPARGVEPSALEAGEEEGEEGEA